MEIKWTTVDEKTVEKWQSILGNLWCMPITITRVLKAVIVIMSFKCGCELGKWQKPILSKALEKMQLDITKSFIGMGILDQASFIVICSISGVLMIPWLLKLIELILVKNVHLIKGVFKDTVYGQKKEKQNLLCEWGKVRDALNKQSIIKLHDAEKYDRPIYCERDREETILRFLNHDKEIVEFIVPTEAYHNGSIDFSYIDQRVSSLVEASKNVQEKKWGGDTFWL